MSKNRYLVETNWEILPFCFTLPIFYFYLHDNCSYCDRFKHRVPKLSSVHSFVRLKNC